MKRTVFKNRWLPYLLVLPQMAVTVVFFFWPAFKSLQLSLFRVSPFGDRTTFVGLENFAKLLADPEYYASVVNSFVFAGSVTALSVGSALVRGGAGRRRRSAGSACTARCSCGRTASRRRWRASSSCSSSIRPTAILPYFLSFVTTYEFNWLLKGWVAMVLVVSATAWTHLGYNIAFYVAGLLAIPGSVLEAADVDGAGPSAGSPPSCSPSCRRSRSTWWSLNMVFAFFESFGVIDAVTKGGPARPPRSWCTSCTRTASSGSTSARPARSRCILMALVIGLTVLQFRFAEKKVTYS